MSFQSAEGSNYINVNLSFVNYPNPQGDIVSSHKITATEFEIAQDVYLASTGLEAPLIDCNDVVAKNLIEAKNEILLTAGEGGVITFEDGTSQSTAYRNTDPDPFEYQQPATPNTTSGLQSIIAFSDVLDVGGVYGITVELEAIPDNAGDCIVDYSAVLVYSNELPAPVSPTPSTILTTTQHKISYSGGGVVNGFTNISLPQTGFVKGLAGGTIRVYLKCTLVSIANGGAPASGYKTNTDSYLNTVRIS
jgi:hypothetical protein